MRLSPRDYIKYKLLNSMFTGLTIGALFTIYTPIEPSIFSLGGVVLAIGMLIVARFYDKILFINRFFQISLLVEVVMLLLVIVFLLLPYSYVTALFVYGGYQITFMFGSYLVRAETLFAKKRKLLTWIDTKKQIGYLAGMVLSWGFYKLFSLYGIDEKSESVYYLHFLLLITEIFIIFYLRKGFKR